MADDQKETLYIDVDDEITAVIDKVQNSPKKIVALVLPKRATVFQSVVNMKLLKRSAENHKKHVVLVTSESALLPLAGAVGLHVAKTPQSKPEIPVAPMAAVAAANAPEDADDLDKTATVGELSGKSEEEPLEVDNTTAPAGAPAAEADKKSKKPKGSGKSKLKIPDFNKFRTKLFLGIAAFVVLIVGYVLAFMVLPKATITLKTDTSTINIDQPFTADTSAEEFDAEEKVLPAISKESRITDTEKVAATGKKDLGKKASGSVTLKLEDCSAESVTVPAGTTVSTDNLAYVTTQSATMQSIEIGGDCRNHDFANISSETVSVRAQNAGTQYNIDSGKSFTVAGYSAVSGENESDMNGGTSKIVKVVTQEDVDKAKQAISNRAKDDAPDGIEDEIREEGYYPLDSTLVMAQPTVTSEPAVGDEAEEVTVTSTTVLKMIGVKEDDLKKLIEEFAKADIDPETQVIRDNGLDEAVVSIDSKNGTRTQLTIQANVIAGPDLNEDEIKEQVAGKKRGEIQELLKQRPGIQEVEVAYSPFWVQKTPGSASKIVIVVEGNQSENADQNP